MDAADADATSSVKTAGEPVTVVLVTMRGERSRLAALSWIGAGDIGQ